MLLKVIEWKILKSYYKKFSYKTAMSQPEDPYSDPYVTYEPISCEESEEVVCPPRKPVGKKCVYPYTCGTRP